MNVLAFAVLMTLALGACMRSGGDPVIDTWPVGAAAECPDASICDELVRVGLAGLAVRDPGHAPVVSTRLHVEGMFTDPAGHKILMTRSGGCCRVLVVELAGGSTRAIGVGYPGISAEAVAIPWETATGR